MWFLYFERRYTYLYYQFYFHDYHSGQKCSVFNEMQPLNVSASRSLIALSLWYLIVYYQQPHSILFNGLMVLFKILPLSTL